MTRLGFRGACFLAAFCVLCSLGECSTTDQSDSSADYADCEEETSLIADGICDAAANTAACGFDGGDCCECTCFVGDVLCDKDEAGYACEDPEAPSDCSLAASSTASSTSAVEQSECEGYVPHIQDGFCDEANNNAACGFDGGDCCACTCGEDLAHVCGVEGDGFDCQDPDVPSNCSLSLGGCGGYTYNIQDSYCNSDLNNAECGYDGGDCCRCTCREYSSYSSCGDYGYDCIDPSAPLDCETDSPTPSPTVSGYPGCAGYGSYIQDSYCHSDLNNEECGYDGGDCCECTCEGGSYGSCGYFGYDCIDPNAPRECEPETGSPTPSPTVPGYPGCVGYGTNIQDSYCHSDLNNEECGYDGGDCCECTCDDDLYGYCGYYGYDCVDPSAPRECELDTDSPTPSPTMSAYPDCGGPAYYLGDGMCDSSTNNLECGWDGGDCCECTCTSSTYACSDYNCLDPSAATDCGAYSATSPSPTPSPSEGDDDECHGPLSCISDGRCDTETNTEACGWDGGDCCPCTCIDGSYNSCGERAGYDCLDPAVADDCPQPTSAPAVFQATPVTGTSYSAAKVGGVVTTAVAFFFCAGVIIVVGLVYARNKCQTGAS